MGQRNSTNTAQTFRLFPAIPAQLSSRILSDFLADDVKLMCQLCQVSKSWISIVNSDNIWQRMFAKRFPGWQEAVTAQQPSVCCWKDRYIIALHSDKAKRDRM